MTKSEGMTNDKTDHTAQQHSITPEDHTDHTPPHQKIFYETRFQRLRFLGRDPRASLTPPWAGMRRAVGPEAPRHPHHTPITAELVLNRMRR